MRELIALGNDWVDLTAVGEPIPERAPPFPLVLASAAPKADRFDWLVEKATELGVARLIPLDQRTIGRRAGGEQDLATGANGHRSVEAVRSHPVDGDRPADAMVDRRRFVSRLACGFWPIAQGIPPNAASGDPIRSVR